jgi:hypothetical protein
LGEGRVSVPLFSCCSGQESLLGFLLSLKNFMKWETKLTTCWTGSRRRRRMGVMQLWWYRTRGRGGDLLHRSISVRTCFVMVPFKFVSRK